MKIVRFSKAAWCTVVLKNDDEWYVLEGPISALGSSLFLTVLDHDPGPACLEPIVYDRLNVTPLKYIQGWYRQVIEDPLKFMTLLVL